MFVVDTDQLAEWLATELKAVVPDRKAEAPGLAKQAVDWLEETEQDDEEFLRTQLSGMLGAFAGPQTDTLVRDLIEALETNSYLVGGFDDEGAAEEPVAEPEPEPEYADEPQQQSTPQSAPQSAQSTPRDPEAAKEARRNRFGESAFNDDQKGDGDDLRGRLRRGEKSDKRNRGRERDDNERDNRDRSRSRSPRGNSRREKQICRAFASTGRCKFGDRCRNLHERTGGDNGTDERPQEICRAFAAKGRCNFGDKCRHKHERAEGQQNANGGDNSNQRGVCVAFRDKGFCRYGDKCRYRHDTSNAPGQEEQGICRAFSERGWCKYGDKCKHKHVLKAAAILEVTGIPPEQNKIMPLMEHFSKFGEVATIKTGLNADGKTARVEFVDKDSAKAAHDAPEAVFGNRFITVSYANLDKPGPLEQREALLELQRRNEEKRREERKKKKEEFVAMKKAEWEAKQAAKKAALMAKAGSGEMAMQEQIRNKAQGLLDESIQQQKMVMEQVEALTNDGKQTEAAEAMQMLQQLQTMAEQHKKTVEEANQALQAAIAAQEQAQQQSQVQEGQQQQQQSGGDSMAAPGDEQDNAMAGSDSVDAQSQDSGGDQFSGFGSGPQGGYYQGGYNPRGGYRGRGTYRGRGAPRGRGRGRGGIFIPNTTGPQEPLDQRTLVLENLPAGTTSKQLFSHFKNYGRIEQLKMVSDSDAYVQYSNSAQAQSAGQSCAQSNFTVRVGAHPQQEQQQPQAGPQFGGGTPSFGHAAPAIGQPSAGEQQGGWNQQQQGGTQQEDQTGWQQPQQASQQQSQAWGQQGHGGDSMED
eukprot:Clim_evm10s54 gene=Clim_evmTU10s54